MEIYSLDFDQTLGKVPHSFDEEMLAFYAKITGASLELLNSFEPAPHSILAQLRNLKEHDLDFPLEATSQKVRAYLEEAFRNILYQETLAIVNNLRNQGARIAITTYGGNDYQSAKITATGLRELTDDVHITQNPNSKGLFIAELAKRYNPERIVHIDDRENELDGVRLAHPKSELIRIIRPDHEDQSPSKYDVIKSLKELV